MAKVLQLINRPESRLDLLKIDGQSIPVLLLDGPAGAPVIPATLQGNIFIDPANSTGNASDANPGTAAAPFASYAGVVKVWGTTKPLLNLATTLIWMSNGPAATDPVIFEPYINGNVAVGIRGNTAAVVSSPVLAGLATKSRALGSNRALSATFNAQTTAGALLQNTTHPSRAWAQRALGANAFQTCQPFVAADGQGVNTTPAEVDTWANGDTVQVLSLIQIPIVRFAPTFLDQMNPQGGFGSGAFIYQCSIVGQGAGSHCVLDGSGGGIHLQEVSTPAATSILWINAWDMSQLTAGAVATNCFFGGLLRTAGAVQFFGGAINNTNGPNTGLNTFQGGSAQGPTVFDGDIIIGGGSQSQVYGDAILGFVFNDITNSSLQLKMGQAVIQAFGYGGAALYGNAGGNGEVQVLNNARLVKLASTWVAQVTNVNMVAGISLNGTRTGVSHTGAAPDVLNGGITTTPANLDAAAGGAGFGGNALSMQLGGASTSNSV
jgi:hypothetical protein